mgnify:FL=1
MKTYNITNRMSKQARKAVENAIATNKKYSDSYFFKPGCTSGTRRGNEERFAKENPDFSLQKGEDTIDVKFSYSESCKNVYYSLTVMVNDEKKDIRALKNLLR